MPNIGDLTPLILSVYFLCMNIAASLLSIIDKFRARSGKWRIPESQLLLLGFLGGAFGEWTTMLLIRHKTKHVNFMILLPLFTTLHVILIGSLILYAHF